MPPNPASTVDLIAIIDAKVKKVHTRSLDLSFNELVDMHQNNELNISPEYQRLFQWTEGAQSRFIESLLLGMPVPPIYVVEEDDGKYLLIDGLQRISSYLQLRGLLEALHLDPKINKGEELVLSDCDIVKDLNGKSWDNLGTSLQIRLKRAFVRVEVVTKGSDARFKYYMFKRLNTGGQILSEQQIRNCTIRLLNAKFNECIIDLSKDVNFLTCIDTVTSERKLAAFDQELVLRFFALKNYRAEFTHDVSDFLTEYMEKVSDPENPMAFDYDAEKAVFKKTFELLAKTLGDLAFTYANRDRSALTRGFSVYHFEALTIGIQSRLAEFDLTDNGILAKLKTTLETIKLDPQFITITTGGGKNSPGPLKARISFVSDRLAEM